MKELFGALLMLEQDKSGKKKRKNPLLTTTP